MSETKALERVRLEILRKAKKYASMNGTPEGLRLAAEIIKEEIRRLEKHK